jgi:ABC-2 type transport system ATP-binding protein
MIYTTHYMEEAERLCDRVAIIDKGRVIATGTKDELVRATVGEKREVVMIEKVPTLESVFLHLTGRELRE